MIHPSRSVRWSGWLAVAVLLVVSGCSTLAGAERPSPVVVGVDLDLSERGESLDAVYRQALELRVEQINQQRERSGGRLVELRLLDSGGDRDTSVANLAELAADPQVSAIITGSCGECVIEAAGDIDAAGVPVISLAAPSAVVEPVAERRFVFRVGPDAAGSADVMAEQLAAGGVATVGLVTGDDRYGADGAAELGEAAAALGIDLAVHEVAAGVDESDLAGLAGRIARWQPETVDPFTPTPPEDTVGLDAVVLWAPELQAHAVAVALRQAGWDGPLWLDAVAAGDLFTDGEVAAALTDARLLFPETLVMDDVVPSLPDLARRREWFTAYTSAFGTYHAPASFAADALDLVVAASDRIGTDPALVRDTFEAIRLAGLTGPLGFSPANHSAFDARSLTVLRFDGDRWHASAS